MKKEEKILAGYGYVLSKEFAPFSVGDYFEGVDEGRVRHLRSGVVRIATENFKKHIDALGTPLDKGEIAASDERIKRFLSWLDTRHKGPGVWENAGNTYSRGDIVERDGERMMCLGDMDEKTLTKHKFRMAKGVIMAWMVFCAGYGMLGLASIITTVSNVLFMCFLLWFVRSEEKRRMT